MVKSEKGCPNDEPRLHISTILFGWSKALITGSSRGIGCETSKILAESGASVILNGRSENTLKERVTELNDAGHDASYIVFDANDADAAVTAASELLEQQECVDILVSNLGAAYRKSLAEAPLDD